MDARVAALEAERAAPLSVNNGGGGRLDAWDACGAVCA